MAAKTIAQVPRQLPSFLTSMTLSTLAVKARVQTSTSPIREWAGLIGLLAPFQPTNTQAASSIGWLQVLHSAMLRRLPPNPNPSEDQPMDRTSANPDHAARSPLDAAHFGQTELHKLLSVRKLAGFQTGDATWLLPSSSERPAAVGRPPRNRSDRCSSYPTVHQKPNGRNMGMGSSRPWVFSCLPRCLLETFSRACGRSSAETGGKSSLRHHAYRPGKKSPVRRRFDFRWGPIQESMLRLHQNAFYDGDFRGQKEE